MCSLLLCDVMDKVTAAEELIDKTLNEVISTEAQNDDLGSGDNERAGKENGKLYFIYSLIET